MADFALSPRFILAFAFLPIPRKGLAPLGLVFLTIFAPFLVAKAYLRFRPKPRRKMASFAAFSGPKKTAKWPSPPSLGTINLVG